MTSDQEHNANREIQKEVLADRRFSLAEVIGREGGDFLKGDSPVPKLVQVATEISLFVNQNVQDSAGVVQAILDNWVKADQVRLSRYLDRPLGALEEILESIVNHPDLLYEFVRHIDMKWGEINDERPHFQRPGQPPHPDDPYTHESVHHQLSDLLDRVRAQQ